MNDDLIARLERATEGSRELDAGRAGPSHHGPDYSRLPVLGGGLV